MNGPNGAQQGDKRDGMEPRAGETWDDLQNGYHILQSREGFRFGIDAVLLADFAYRALTGYMETALPVERPLRMLDLGCGNGIIPLLLAARFRSAAEWRIIGLELQEEGVDLARRSVRGNALEEMIHIVQGDIKEVPATFAPGSFHAVVCNPPYWAAGTGKIGGKRQRAIARHEICCTFREVASAAGHVLGEDAPFFLIHRAQRRGEILRILREQGLRPLRLRPVRPFADREANLILIEARPAGTPAGGGIPAGGPDLKEEAPIIVYDRPGVYTREVLGIYGAEQE